MVCLLPNAEFDMDILDEEIEMRREMDRGMFKVWVFPEYISVS